LQSSIARWLTRDDLTDVIPDFIAMAEVRLNDRLRLAPMEKASTFSQGTFTRASVIVDEEGGAYLIDESDGAYITDEDADTPSLVLDVTPLPSDFLEMRMLIANTSPKRATQLAAPGWATLAYESGPTGYPSVYTIIGSNLGIWPTATTTMTMTYYARIPALSSDEPTNWLLTQRPNMYLYASLIESAPLMRDDARIAIWKGLLDEAINDARYSDLGTRWSNAGLTLSGPMP
jgi:hypothetical protein